MPTFKRRSKSGRTLPRPQTSTCVAAGIAALAALPHTAQATQYSLEYELDTRYRYNDNVGLRPDNEVDVHGAQLILPAKLSMNEERYTAYVDSEIASSKYDDSGYNSDDQKLMLGGEYLFERARFGATAGIDRNSTTQTAFLDNGVVGASADRVERYSAGLNGLYYFSQKNAIVSGLSYLESDYDTPRLVDNENRSAYFGVSHQYSPETQLTFRGTAGRFENDARVSIESDSVGLQIGLSSEYSERLSYSIMGGYSEVETEYFAVAGVITPEDDDTSGWLLNSSLTYEGERSSLKGTFTRRENASADGYLIVSNQLNVDYRYDLTERSRLLVEFIGGQSGALDDRINNDRDYASAKLRGSYRLAESWYLSGSYSYRYQDRERESGDATQNLVNLSIIYRPNALSWSR